MKQKDIVAQFQPFADKLAAELAAIAAGYLDSLLEQARAHAIDSLRAQLEPKTETPARTRKVKRADTKAARLAKITRSALAAREASAKVEPPPPAAVKRQRAQMRCSKCGELGFRSDGCGRTHNVVPTMDDPPASDEDEPGAAQLAPQTAPEILADVPRIVTGNGRVRPASRRYRGLARAFTIPTKTSDARAFQRLRLDVVADDGELAVADEMRPRTRGDCKNGVRPCPWVGCEQHLYLDVDPETGSLKINFPGVEPTDLAESCALDVADRGGITLEECAEVMNLTRERVRQIEIQGVLEMKRRRRRFGDMEDCNG